MRQTIVALVVLVVSMSSSVSGASAVGSDQPDLKHSTHHVLVKLALGVDADEALGPAAERVLDRWVTVPMPKGLSSSEAVEMLGSRPGVERAELDYLVTVEPVPKAEARGTSAPSNDPLSSLQWHLPQVQTEQAWTESTGDGVVVAVLDSGVSQGGEDLDCHTFVDPYNAITQTQGASAVDDDNGHGTHVAGTVAQCTNNGVGVAGVAFDASLMPVKVLDSSGSGLFSWIARGVDWARNHNADVINLSLGCSRCTSSLLADAIDAAIADGVVVVAASGNNNAGIVQFPANHTGVMAVGATDFDKQRAPYSNRGNALDFTAPGGNLNEDSNGDGQPDGVLQESFEFVGPDRNFGYYFFQGTSMATPHVSGAVALLKSLLPGIDTGGVSNILEATSLDLGSPGFDTSFGHGFIQIRDAIDYATTLDITPPTWPGGAVLTASGATEDSIALDWPSAADDRFLLGYRVYRDGVEVKSVGSATTTTVVGNLAPATSYDFSVRAEDGGGNLSTAISVEASTLDTIPPTWGPGSELTVTKFGETSLEVAWGAASDNLGVTEYLLRLSGTTGTTHIGTKATVTGLDPGEEYVFEVLARDGAGNWSEPLSATVRTARAFTDTQGHLFYRDILWMSGMDITRGCNPPINDLFCPDEPVTRSTMAAFMVRALGLTENTHPGFVDVAVGSTFAEDIGRLATAGITRGCNPPENDRFCPNDPVSRETMAAFMVRALGLTENTHPGFVDVASGSTFAEDIGRLATAGITRGCNPPENDRYCPGDVVSRGQLAAFLKRPLG